MQMNAILVLLLAVAVFSALSAGRSCRSTDFTDRQAVKKNLTFSLIVSFGEDGFNSSGAIPAINLALEHINWNESLLANYTLGYTLGNSKCNRIESLNSFFRDFLPSSVGTSDDPVRLAVLGCGCSVATEPVAEISHHWNISQISFASALSSLSDRERFRSYFRDFPTFANLAPALLAVLNEYQWKRLAFLTQNENLFTNLYFDFKNLIEKNQSRVCCFDNTNITFTQALFDTKTDPATAVKKIFEEESDYRVFFLNAYSDIALEVVCEAAKRKLHYPHYAWIMYSWYPEYWWTRAVNKLSRNTRCSDTEIEDFIERARPIVIRQIPSPDDDTEIIMSNHSARCITELYERRIADKTDGDYEKSIVSSLAYDAVWVLALGLERALGFQNKSEADNITDCGNWWGDLVPLERFNYSNGYMGCVIRWALSKTDFVGSSGPIRFNSNGTVIETKLRLFQYRRHKNEAGKEIVERIRYGYVNDKKQFSVHYEEGESQMSVYPDGLPPDGTPVEVAHGVNTALTCLYYIIASVGLCCSAACLIFNITLRKRKVIQIASPNLNYFLIAGSALMYTSAYLAVLPSTDETYIKFECIVYIWFFLVGYLLATGTVLAKMCRVYQIFHNPAPSKKVLRDAHLILIILCVTGVGILLLVIHSSTQTSPPVLVPDAEQMEGRTELGVRELYHVWICYSSDSPTYYVDLVIMTYTVILQIVAIVLCFQTRKVKVAALNDSKFVAAIVYLSSIILFMLILVIFTLKSYTNIRNGVFVGGILTLASVFLGLTYVPRIIHLYNDPKGEKLFKATQANHTVATTNNLDASSNGTTLNTMNDTEKASHHHLRQRVQELEKKLDERDRVIGQLQQKACAGLITELTSHSQ